jgi:hypothetical protein
MDKNKSPRAIAEMLELNYRQVLDVVKMLAEQNVSGQDFDYDKVLVLVKEGRCYRDIYRSLRPDLTSHAFYAWRYKLSQEQQEELEIHYDPDAIEKFKEPEIVRSFEYQETDDNIILPGLK